MSIHEKKECPNRIITSSNMEITNLVKETLLPTSYINPPFAFPAPNEKHKCISASMWMGIFFSPLLHRRDFFILFFSHVRIDGSRVRIGGLHIRADAACVRVDRARVRADRVLLRVDAVKTCPWIKLRLGGKKGLTRSFV
jgi:hypothetical protein